MKQFMQWIGRAAVAAMLAIPAMSTTTHAQTDDLTKVTFSLDFIVLGRHAPWFVALAKGYYEDEGLDVTIVPGQGSAQVIQAVESGIAQVGFVDVPGLVLARAAGSTIKMVAVNYQKAPYAVFSLASGANVTDADQLEGLTIGSGSGSFTPRIIRGFMVQNGLDPDSLNVANVAPPARGGALLGKEIEAIEFFVMSQAGLTRAAAGQGDELRTFLLGDHGLELYSNGIAATESFINENPEVVRGFVRASLRGWQDAIRNPEEAAQLQRRFAEGLDPEIIAAEVQIVANLAITDDTLTNGLGSFTAERMQKSLDFVIRNIGVEGNAPTAADLFVEGFLPDTPVLP